MYIQLWPLEKKTFLHPLRAKQFFPVTYNYDWQLLRVLVFRLFHVLYIVDFIFLHCWIPCFQLILFMWQTVTLMFCGKQWHWCFVANSVIHKQTTTLYMYLLPRGSGSLGGTRPVCPALQSPPACSSTLPASPGSCPGGSTTERAAWGGMEQTKRERDEWRIVGQDVNLQKVSIHRTMGTPLFICKSGTGLCDRLVPKQYRSNYQEMSPTICVAQRSNRQCYSKPS